jgi:DNA uptake protein ComE-like DNA-binding protein
VPYNSLTATPLAAGRYLLRYPGYSPQIRELATLIVKGTIVNPLLAEFRDLGLLELLQVEDSIVRNTINNPQDAINLHPFPAQFQVVEFAPDGIVIWITQPVLRPTLIQDMARGAFDNAEFSLLHFTPVAKPFMVEVSAYGPRLDEVLAGGRGVGGDVGPRPINLNTATVADLTTLPGIGRATAQLIIAARPAGGFRSLDELLVIQGMTRSLLDSLRDRITL